MTDDIRKSMKRTVTVSRAFTSQEIDNLCQVATADDKMKTSELLKFDFEVEVSHSATLWTHFKGEPDEMRHRRIVASQSIAVFRQTPRSGP